MRSLLEEYLAITHGMIMDVFMEDGGKEYQNRGDLKFILMKCQP